MPASKQINSPPTHDENDVLRRMLSTPPKQHQAKPEPGPKKAPAKKSQPKEKP